MFGPLSEWNNRVEELTYVNRSEGMSDAYDNLLEILDN